MSDTIALAKALIEKPSVSPEDAGCQDLIAEQLAPLGFNLETLAFPPVTNLWARRGDSGPLFVFAGHTDVVPAGDLTQWQSHPFTPEIKDGMLHGRGAADMKGSLAAMVVACKNFIAKNPNHRGSIALLITSDEEADNYPLGTMKVMEVLNQRGELPNYCLVGEPSSSNAMGDTIKHGRRGSLSGKLTLHGIQGHVAYPQFADNPIHRGAAVLAELSSIAWDKGNAHFPATTFQVSNIQAGTGAGNVIPGSLTTQFNFRYSTEVTAEELQDRVNEVMLKHNVKEYNIDWTLSGKPFLTDTGELLEATQQAITTVTGLTPVLSTEGGTSDGRHIAPYGCQVIELGPCNATIHKANECVSVSDLEKLAEIYEQVLVNLL